jgi:hypothetical protein
MLRVAAETFSVRPQSGSEGQSLTHARVEKVFTSIDTTIILLEDDGARTCLIASHFLSNHYAFSNLLKKRAGKELGIAPERIFTFSSHNHTDTILTKKPLPTEKPTPSACLKESDLSVEGLEVLEKLQAAAGRLPGTLAPAWPWWGQGKERRITYNRKGRRPDGTTYFMREEDRSLLGKDYSGDIDADAPVVAFIGDDGTPLCFIVQFAGHPTTCYHPEHPVVHGDYPQEACRRLSRAFGGVPVAFLQGCCGNLNSKCLLSPKPLSEKVADAARHGKYLGETYIAAARKLHRSSRDDVVCEWSTARLPFKKVPSAAHLRRQLAEIQDFMQRCARGDSTALTCVGINTSRTMSPRYRAALLEPVRRWTEWALRFRTEDRMDEAPDHADFRIGGIRIGDVGIVGMPCEPFLGIGRRIKKESDLPLAIPCGYMDDEILAYVPDGPNNGDSEYISAYYRYTTSLLPYRDPAGDRLADSAVRLLNGLARRRSNGSKRRNADGRRGSEPGKRDDRRGNARRA